MDINLYDGMYYWVRYADDDIEIARYIDNNFYFCGYDAPVHKDKVNALGYVLNPYSGYHDVEEFYKDDEEQ